ncbi:hypothetical protein SARC_04237 [Sphaeroforma arctica JP610]|uniref:Uncharacterized protein n=1 Tax=Sphaeroforma arctica JP610 TaxID=667725 RepID=A0A0L0G3U4_9EUKA|nr:hypothetical protein SARC_04237 [Sphaeroforma arctica JP610]KNC83506.1 hypothetical protein SARC_04237 [Sphaeroforma arctica JP610]|eukprot:XP_014157408.1 hypothetical protein SARC_04237 [Sphaeroforma arctica JP610]
MYGGMNGKRLGDVWVFDTATHTWTQAATGTHAHTPCARSLHTMVVVGSRAYVFAGWSPVVGGGVAGAAEEWECTNSLGCLDLGLRMRASV